jgi:hypothetical protein
MTAEPLAKPAAKALDKRVRAASDRVAADIGKLLVLLAEAVTGQIDAALGCASLRRSPPPMLARERRWRRWCLTSV